jgi:hypothetical protein
MNRVLSFVLGLVILVSPLLLAGCTSREAQLAANSYGCTHKNFHYHDEYGVYRSVHFAGHWTTNGVHYHAYNTYYYKGRKWIHDGDPVVYCR